ncbi:MAG: prepilin-type N-terminal cleavage/methylation domain-containing protein [Opitutaceae bacterium]|nr:prepilin-type N-terminal cleavage/methylation domain-containing protein [Opitutaceae bacterium]
MKTASRKAARCGGFTLVETMITVGVMVVVMAGALGIFVTGLRAMYKDMQRLATDSKLRALTLQIAKETLDSSEFYVFDDYAKLDGSVDLAADVAVLSPDVYATQVAYGDCLVLVTRINVDDNSNVRQIRIYYRDTTNPNNTAAIRYYEGTDYGSSGTTTSLTTLLNAINLSANPAITGSRILAATTRGRPMPSTTHYCPIATPTPFGSTCTHTTDYYPIFSTESATTTPTCESVAINVEVINGTTSMNQLSSSSFNYTISPRR